MLIGRYRLKEPIAQGGMGSVWSAIDTRLTRYVAVKLLPRILVTDPSAERRFEREARAMSRLQHANVVSIYDVGQADPGTGEELPFLVMELIRGESLDKILANGSIAPIRAARILGQVGRALGAAHEAGVVHRDLKPSNVMVSESDHVKVLDFGLARLVCQDGHTPEDTLTTPGMVLGSCPYMAPEQALGQQVTPASDIFSCGAVLYEALSGQRTFNGSTPMRVLQAVVRCEYEPLKEIAPLVPNELVEIIDTCLAKDSGKRFMNGSSFANALFDIVDNGILDNEVTAVFEPVTTEIEKPPLRKTFKSLLVMATLFATLSIGGALGVFFSKNPSSLADPDPSLWSQRTVLETMGTLHSPDWHPNGNELVVLHQSDASWEILVVPAHGDSPVVLFRSTDHEILSFPQYSPDGTTISIGSRIGDADVLRIISTSDGTVHDEIPGAYRGTWLGDGRILCSRIHGTPRGLFIHDLATDVEEQLEVPDPRGTWRYALPIPLSLATDKLALLDGIASKSALVVFSAPNHQSWLEPQDGIDGFDWAPSGDSIIAAIKGELVHISPQGKRRLFPDSDLQDPCFAPDGRTISVTENTTHVSTHIWADRGEVNTEEHSRLILFDGVDPDSW